MSGSSILDPFAARLREFIGAPQRHVHGEHVRTESAFNQLALELFSLQLELNRPYRQFCESRRASPESVRHWTQIPAVPTAAFKELELSCIPASERAAVFHSSGTTIQTPSRHFHNERSLAMYEAALLPWFEANVLGSLDGSRWNILCLTPNAHAAPHSSLVYMFESVVRKFGSDDSCFCGFPEEQGTWAIDFDLACEWLERFAARSGPALVLGTAFSFVHLLDHLLDSGRKFILPAGSRVMETGGYKGRSRSIPKPELHALLSEYLGVSESSIVCEYGMSELSSQAYDGCSGDAASRTFHFPPWARAQIVSPETGAEVADSQCGLLRILDLANAYSVLSVQTEDLAVRRGRGFELLGRAVQAEPRGCSLMAL